ncbi:MAG: hypothetical protein COA42_08835 [Alteromonadaceae bacterium]|nr:MAG: hypothetical protein COA42_08835 [Alteromonadaceae bacterium]
MIASTEVIQTTNADTTINHKNSDAIYMACPPDSHTEYALKVAAAGKICCIEKPMATNHKDCETICDAFEQHTRTGLWMKSWAKYNSELYLF